MKSPVVRRARPSDAAEIAVLARRGARWTREAFAAEADRPEAVFLVIDEGGVRGYAVARVVGDEAQLLDIAAAEDGRGIGRRLWEALVDEARRRGASRLTFEVSAGNARARRFYERAGARVVGRRAKFYNDASDAVLMDFSLA